MSTGTSSQSVPTPPSATPVRPHSAAVTMCPTKATTTPQSKSAANVGLRKTYATCRRSFHPPKAGRMGTAPTLTFSTTTATTCRRLKPPRGTKPTGSFTTAPRSKPGPYAPQDGTFPPRSIGKRFLRKWEAKPRLAPPSKHPQDGTAPTAAASMPSQEVRAAARWAFCLTEATRGSGAQNRSGIIRDRACSSTPTRPKPCWTKSTQATSGA